jgi:hypothetical protein
VEVAGLLERCHAVPLPSAASVARDLTAAYLQWSLRGDTGLVELADGFVRSVGASDTALGRACLLAADRTKAWGGHPYHSIYHHAEVATNVMVIAELGARLNRPVLGHGRLLLLASSLAHDLYYDPSLSGSERFHLERISARALDSIAELCGVGMEDRETLALLVLSTEPGFRSDLREILANYRSRQELPAVVEAVGRRPDLAELAAMLSDADLLSSVGLTRKWNRVQHRRLEQELGCRVSPLADSIFLETVVGPGFLSPGGQYFDGNLARIRQMICSAATA